MDNNRSTMTRQAALKELEEFRGRIDAVDRSILLLLNERTKVVEEIGRVKQKAQLPIYEPRREDQVFENVVRHNTGPLTEQAVRRIFERIIDEMRSVQREQMEKRADGESAC
jgi:chorismate mutase-like protein